ITMSKSRTDIKTGQPVFPKLLSGGPVSVYVGDRSERFRLAAPRPVKSPLDGAFDSVNREIPPFLNFPSES
ncbi:hypothetical protein, partial [Sphingobium yanoikuyae]|uniref:hypothetical protein n=1 Tax=Sphingobium yanoikuyae TaxID=13690 RepID=UPI00293C706A